MEGSVGLTNVLIGDADLEDMLQPYGDSNLTVLGCGPIPPNPAELLGSARMRSLIQDLEQRFDIVLIDAPPLLPVTDAAVLTSITDGAILVVGAGVIKNEHFARSWSGWTKRKARSWDSSSTGSPPRAPTPTTRTAPTTAPTSQHRYAKTKKVNPKWRARVSQ